MARRILITCAYSPLNLGDGAIIGSMHGIISRHDPHAKIAVHTFTDGDALFPRELGVEANKGVFVAPVDRGTVALLRWAFANLSVALVLVVGGLLGDRGMRPLRRLVPRRQRDAISRMLAADVIIAAGGGYLTDEFRLMPFLALEIWVGSRLRPTLLGAQTIGPLHSAAARLLVRLALRDVEVMHLRDDYSLEVLDALGDRSLTAKALRVPDYAFALDAIDEAAASTLPKSAFIAVSVRSWHFPREPGSASLLEQYRNAIAEAIPALIDLGYDVVLVATNYAGPGSRDDDVAECEEICRRVATPYVPAVHVVRELLSPSGLRAVISRSALLIATRMHAAIFAISVGVPVVILSYQPKGMALMEGLGRPQDATEAAAVTSEWIISRALELLRDGNQFPPLLRPLLASEAEDALQAWLGRH